MNIKKLSVAFPAVWEEVKKCCPNVRRGRFNDDDQFVVGVIHYCDEVNKETVLLNFGDFTPFLIKFGITVEFENSMDLGQQYVIFNSSRKHLASSQVRMINPQEECLFDIFSIVNGYFESEWEAATEPSEYVDIGAEYSHQMANILGNV